MDSSQDDRVGKRKFSYCSMSIASYCYLVRVQEGEIDLRDASQRYSSGSEIIGSFAEFLDLSLR